jgi:hypothetical protein
MARPFPELLTMRVWGEVQRNAPGKRIEVVAERIEPVWPVEEPLVLEDLVACSFRR